ncbi:MAG: DUF2130 domain-containing protein [Acidobacteria bacterium]|nr:DUF2130 domain-containing protein [Acidobacteriota bacterium]
MNNQTKQQSAVASKSNEQIETPNALMSIPCPNCHTVFDASTVIQKHVERQAKEQVAAKEAELARMTAELAKSKEELDAQVRQQVDAERKKLAEQARASAADEFAAQIKAKEDEASEARAKLKAAQEKELEILKAKNALEEQAANQELTLQRKLEEERAATRKAVQESADELRRLELASKEEELALLRSAAEAAKKREKEIEEKAANLAKAEEGLQAKLREQLAAEREVLSKQARAAAVDEVAAQMKAKEDEVTEARAKLKAAQEKELEILKAKNALEEQAAELELSVARRLDEERAQIRQQALAKAQEGMDLKLKDKDLKMAELREQIEQLTRKMEQGSQQAQGEAQEILLEELLRREFPRDLIREVAKGADGADVLQVVRDDNGRDCGSILWESKRTKNWSDSWLGKLKADLTRENATVPALATQALPKDFAGIGQLDGVWVCAFSHALPMAHLLRDGMVKTAGALKSTENQQEKMAILYRYLTGSEFRSRVTSVSQAWNQMLEDLCDERKAMEKLWNKRQRLLTQAMTGLQGIDAEFQRIAGAEVRVLSTSEGSVKELEAVAEAGSVVDTLIDEGATPKAIDPQPLLPAEAYPLDDRAAERAQRESQFMAALAGFGGKSGNISLREVLGLSEEDYDETKRRLVAKNQIHLGLGKGGSVRLASLQSE